ncbi:MAG: hypothetical protein IPI81_09350 [Flavobacteriales bacterium]|nr:hypothetical protein [Flavobacteriales bacterium]MCC6937505.1 hypothetical protein [Flavobacteriales bacterium]
MRIKWFFVLLAIVVMVIACRHETDEVVPPDIDPSALAVSVDLDQVPYPTLSAYHFFTGVMVDQTPNGGVLPYDVITPLFSDYARKFHFVWMPQGSSATFDGPDASLAFPNGAVLIKTFYFDNVQPTNERKVLETRLLIRRNGQWLFADYVWNAEQTEATLDLNGRSVPFTWRDDQQVMHDLNYRIPAAAECFTCHKLNNNPVPIGTKARNMAHAFNYPDGVQEQLAKWVEVGYLEAGFPTPQPVAKWNDVNVPLNDRVRAYVDMNCAHCHADGKHCDYRPMRFAWQETDNPINLGVCVEPEDPLPGHPELTYIVAPSNLARSMLLHRISSTDEAVRMPLLGRTVVHEEAVELFTEWINSLNGPCN